MPDQHDIFPHRQPKADDALRAVSAIFLFGGIYLMLLGGAENSAALVGASLLAFLNSAAFLVGWALSK